MEVNRSILLNSINEIVNELVDTSSSSSDNEIESLVFRTNVRPRVKGFVENVNSFSAQEFKKNFRINRNVSDYLTAKYASSSWYTTRSYKGGRQQTPVETQMLAFLWFAANKTTIREVGNLFNMSLSNFYKTFNNVMNFFVKDMAPGVIRFPKDTQEKDVIAKEFENIAGFPNVLGCIDDSFITSGKLKHKTRSSNDNMHDCVSITLQGICDAKLRFLDIFTGVSNKTNDARVLKLSSIGKELPKLCAPRYYLLGNSAYPLREYLLTPFRDNGNLSEAESLYNTKFVKTRVKIENAFGMLKSRFLQLMRLDFQNAESMSKFVTSCCALHNICIEMDDFFEFSTTNDEAGNISAEKEDTREYLPTQLGEIKRNEIKNHFYSSRL
ncbi:putative nuclease HARBI1 isoform X1 [Anastrepha ludens]|uniref:putative nuclease HARBI1 isoform X1 n=1 Tax=Anastrepha ludens TaxID=28586 RepID=UPI0023B17C8F|nr:putative nuclease HARBI1 isoform X1 [Anastrepha ludens]